MKVVIGDLPFSCLFSNSHGTIGPHWFFLLCELIVRSSLGIQQFLNIHYRFLLVVPGLIEAKICSKLAKPEIFDPSDKK